MAKISLGGSKIRPSNTGTISTEDDQSDHGYFNVEKVLLEMLGRLIRLEREVELLSSSKDSSTDSPSPDSDTEQPSALDSLPLSSWLKFWKWWSKVKVGSIIKKPPLSHSLSSLTQKQQQTLVAFIVSLDDKDSSASMERMVSSTKLWREGSPSSTPTLQEKKSLEKSSFEPYKNYQSDVPPTLNKMNNREDLDPRKKPHLVTDHDFEKARKLLLDLREASRDMTSDWGMSPEYTGKVADEAMEALGMQPLRKEVQDDDVPPAARLPGTGPSFEATHTPRAGSTD